ncbi:MAG: OsmC family protein [Cellvibrionales bacterium]|nr:OsmC family protein [Cellvibrionales bacterium]
MKIEVSWQGDVAFEGKDANGHSVIMDGPEEKGGQNKGFRPMSLLLAGMGGCSSYDVIQILQKSRQKVTDCKVSVEAERVDDVPAVFSKIHLHFVVKGEALKEKQVERAVGLSADKYCSASIMMQSAGVEVTHSYEIIEA